MFEQFKNRSTKLERIDTGDYTSAEYERFLKEIRLINLYAGDRRALTKSLIKEVKRSGVKGFSVLDVGAGSGELLRVIAKFARKTGRAADLCGLELSDRSAGSILEGSRDFGEIRSIRGDVLELPFGEDSFDYVICSLFTHHFKDEQIVEILKSFSAIARKKIFVIDLHRHPAAYVLFRSITKALRVSTLVRDDGALSVLRGFIPEELEGLAARSGLSEYKVTRVFPFRLVLEA